MKIPLVSIILPTWNRAHLIDKAIRIILEQTYKNFELMVVDDGSTDNTEDIVRGVIRETGDARINYIKLSTHEGGAQARNHAIKKARGEFIASQDDDDKWHATFLERQVQNLLSLPKEYALSYVSYYNVYQDGKRVLMPPRKLEPKEGNMYGGDIMQKNFFPFQTALIRKEVLDEIGLVNEEMESLYDWEMWLRISKKYKIAHINEPLFIRKVSLDSNSTDPKKIWRRINARKLILREFGDDLEKFGYFPNHCSRLADLLMAAGNKKEARAILRKGILSTPPSPILFIKLLASLLGSNAYQKLAQLRRETILKRLKFV